MDKELWFEEEDLTDDETFMGVSDGEESSEEETEEAREVDTQNNLLKHLDTIRF